MHEIYQITKAEILQKKAQILHKDTYGEQYLFDAKGNHY